MKGEILNKLPVELKHELTSDFAINTPKFKSEYFKWGMNIIYLLNLERDKKTITQEEFMEIYNEMFAGYVNLVVGECPHTLTNPEYQRRMWDSLFYDDKEVEV